MDRDPTERLMAQFSSYISNKDIGVGDWKMLTSEYMVREEAENTFRFFRSWNWGDEDRSSTTLEFLRKVNKEDEETALALMKGVYDFVGSADEKELEKYPALQALEKGQSDIELQMPNTNLEPYIDIDNTTDDFYDELIDNINRCYQIEVYDGTLVLTRKLLENLVIELLRQEYPKSYVRMYHIPEQQRFRNFSELLEVFEYRLKDYQSYSNGVDGELIENINQFRDSANSDAHSIVRNPSKENVDDLGEDAEYAAKVMFRILRNMD